jgi:hypothetical protein
MLRSMTMIDNFIDDILKKRVVFKIVLLITVTGLAVKQVKGHW